MSRCAWCGANGTASCRAPDGRKAPRHADRHDSGQPRLPRVGNRSVTSRDEADAIRRGALLAPLETLLKGDGVHLDAWRVRVGCACLIRVPTAYGLPVARAVLARWTLPAALALASPKDVKGELAPIWLTSTRHGLIRTASLVAAFEDIDVPNELDYPRDAVAVIVLGDLMTSPHDKALRAVRERQLRKVIAA
jgi:hypothetical protein